MINLILFGPPGSGKGTQAKFIAEKFDLLHISTGDLFRSEIGNKTELGLLAKSYMDKGELVPDEVTVNMLKKRVQENPDVSGYIFDGFPRTIPQAEALDAMLAESGEEVTCVLELDVPDEELIARLQNRAKTSGRTDDADVDVIKNRLDVYKNYTATVATHYAAKNKTQKVDGVGDIAAITNRLTDALNSYLKPA